MRLCSQFFLKSREHKAAGSMELPSACLGMPVLLSGKYFAYPVDRPLPVLELDEGPETVPGKPLQFGSTRTRLITFVSRQVSRSTGGQKEAAPGFGRLGAGFLLLGMVHVDFVLGPTVPHTCAEGETAGRVGWR